MRATAVRASGVVGALVFGVSVSTAEAQVQIASDERTIEAYAQVTAPLGFLTDAKYTEVPDGFAWNETLITMAATELDSTTASASHRSEVNPGRVVAQFVVSNTSAATFGTNYSTAASLMQLEFTVSSPTPYGITGTITANHTGARKNANSSVSLYSSTAGEYIFNHAVEVTDGVASEPIADTGVLQPGSYVLACYSSVPFQEIEQEALSGHATLDVVIDLGDRDGDGLLDLWETDGIDADGDGTIDLDLPAMGADPDKKDLFVEVDAMIGRAPLPGLKELLEAAFAAAPVEGSSFLYTGINLHFMEDETNTLFFDFPNAFADFDIYKAGHLGTEAERSSPNWPNIRAARMLSFRYCVFANTYGGTTSSGLAELPGNDLMVTLGGWTTPGGTLLQQAGTFMHEFGHTLGIGHGGVDHVNYKPNYYSLMNYHWQTPQSGYAEYWRLDYSREQFPDLIEDALDEQAGIGATLATYASVRAPFTANGGWHWARLISGHVADWDGDGFLDSERVSSDLNRQGPSDPVTEAQRLRGANDWGRLWYHLSGASAFADGAAQAPDEPEFSAEDFEAQNLIPSPPGCFADLTGDGTTNVRDFNVLASSYGRTVERYTGADLDGDGVVTCADFNILAGEFGCTE